jgi:predicted AAA+ superfamily ATPase
VKIWTDMVLEYLSYWTKVYLLNQIKSLEPVTKKFFEIYNKYFVWDIGLRNAIVGYNLKKDNWKLLENFVYLELKRNGYDIKIWRLKNWQEIDFVATKNWITKYFQVCYLLNSEETIQREYSSLESIRDNWEKYVVSFDELDFWINKWIKWVNVMELNKVL